MTNATLPAELIVPDVDEKTHNENLIAVAREEAESFQRLSDVFPGLVVSPGIATPPRVRLQRFMTLLMQAYPDDPAGRMRELQWLLRPDYLDYLKEGLAPPPLARPWSQLLPIRFLFREVQTTLRHDFASFAKQEGIE